MLRSRPRTIAPDLLLGALAGLYVLIVSALALQGTFVFVRKSAIVPAFCLAALLSRRLTLFVRDWAVFLGLTFLFDAARGAIFAAITRFDLPVYMGYAIAMERALLGGSTMPVLLQGWWYGGAVGWLERLMVMVHASHFVFFLTIGLAVWLLRSQTFARYCTVMILVMYAGLLAYALFPTVPPWMASADYQVIPPVERISFLLYNRVVPGAFAALATNPVAAMPSLHAAFPSAASLVALHVFGRRASWTLAYTALAGISVMYLGEHYLVDVLAGWLLGAAAYVIVFRWRAPRTQASVPDRADPLLRRQTVTAVILAAGLVLVAEGVGLLKHRLEVQFVPTTAFIERELAGRSPRTSHYMTLRALKDGDAPESTNGPLK